VVNVRDLSKLESGSVVDEAALIRAGLVKGRRDGIKLLGHGQIKIPLTIKVNAVSKDAREKIIEAGGNVKVL
jgi:large subunit ribosomal protein L15